jgi:hypothetical protein
VCETHGSFSLSVREGASEPGPISCGAIDGDIKICGSGKTFAGGPRAITAGGVTVPSSAVGGSSPLNVRSESIVDREGSMISFMDRVRAGEGGTGRAPRTAVCCRGVGARDAVAGGVDDTDAAWCAEGIGDVGLGCSGKG